MERLIGFVTTKKLYYKGKEISGVSFSVKQDPMSPDGVERPKIFFFWINHEGNRDNFNKYKHIIDNIPNSAEEVKEAGRYKIEGSFEPGKFNALKDFVLSENLVDAKPDESEITKAYDKVEGKEEKPTDMETWNLSDIIGWKDVLIARENTLNATAMLPFENPEERVEYCKRLLKYLIRGE